MLRILLIEDSDTDADMVERALHDHVQGAQYSRASTAAEGERLLREQSESIDVILLDLFLPDTGAPDDTYKRVKKEAGEIPIIVISGLQNHELAKSLVGAGAEDYLNKDHIASDPALIRNVIDFGIERHTLYKKIALKAQQESNEKDAILNCFMGGYSVETTNPPKKPKGGPF